MDSHGITMTIHHHTHQIRAKNGQSWYNDDCTFTLFVNLTHYRVICCTIKLQMDPGEYGIVLLINIINNIIVIGQYLYTISTMDVLDSGAQRILENCLLPIVVPIVSTSIPIFLGPWIATDWDFWTS